MKTKLLKQLRREANKNVPQPEPSLTELTAKWIIGMLKWDNEVRDYILRRVAELKTKLK